MNVSRPLEEMYRYFPLGSHSHSFWSKIRRHRIVRAYPRWHRTICCLQNYSAQVPPGSNSNSSGLNLASLCNAMDCWEFVAICECCNFFPPWLLHMIKEENPFSCYFWTIIIRHWHCQESISVEVLIIFHQNEFQHQHPEWIFIMKSY